MITNLEIMHASYKIEINSKELRENQIALKQSSILNEFKLLNWNIFSQS